MSIKVAVCQVPDIREDVEAALNWIEQFSLQAEREGVSLICFPECFLQGYLTEMDPAFKNAVDLSSIQFYSILKRLSSYKLMIVFGLIEYDNGLLFNTAAVIKDGLLIGKYRKTHLLDGESIFTAGSEYPVFEVNDLKFGINICYDTQFQEATNKLTDQGAKLIVCISNTMMSLKKAEKFKYLHFSIRAERIKESQTWMVCSDITGETPGRIAYGSTCIINPLGEIAERLPFMETGMILVEI